MQRKVSVILLVIATLGMIGLFIKPLPSQFHVSVFCWQFAYEKHYSIHYTSNIYGGQDDIEDVFDFSDMPTDSYSDSVIESWIGSNNIGTFRYTNDDRNKAIEFAKRFKTYNDVEKYHDSLKIDVKIRQAYRKEHPVSRKEEENKDLCCEPDFKIK